MQITIEYKLPHFTFSSLQHCCLNECGIKILRKITHTWARHNGEKLPNAEEMVTTTKPCTKPRRNTECTLVFKVL